MSDNDGKAQKPDDDVVIGAVPPEDAPKTIEEALNRARLEQVYIIAGFVNAFTEIGEKEAVHLGDKFLTQQQHVGQIIIDATDAAKRKEHTQWGYRIHDAKTRHLLIEAVAPKDLAGASVGEVLRAMHILGLVLTPALRAILYAHGYGVEFVQGSTSKLVYPKGAKR